jgi:hypothetical protein
MRNDLIAQSKLPLTMAQWQPFTQRAQNQVGLDDPNATYEALVIDVIIAFH